MFHFSPGNGHHKTKVKGKNMKRDKIRKIAPALFVLFLLPTLLWAAGDREAIEQIEVQKEEISFYPFTFRDSYDREVTLEKEPKRIIAVAPNITETFFALGRGDLLVGRTDYCDYPEAAASVESIGSLMEPNIEKIVELDPDIVIASTHFKKEVLEKLEGHGIKVAVLYGPESFEGVYETIFKIADIVQAQEQAEDLVSRMKAKVEDLDNRLKGASKPAVYYVIGFGEYGDFTAGEDTFIGTMIEMAGATNAAGDVKGWKYSLEKLVEKDPDILICSKYWDAKAGIMAANGYKDLTAVKENRLFEIDNNLLDRQGPRLADGLEALVRFIHPELF